MISHTYDPRSTAPADVAYRIRQLVRISVIQPRRRKPYVRNTVIFWFLTFLFAGAVICVPLYYG